MATLEQTSAKCYLRFDMILKNLATLQHTSEKLHMGKFQKCSQQQEVEQEEPSVSGSDGDGASPRIKKEGGRRGRGKTLNGPSIESMPPSQKNDCQIFSIQNALLQNNFLFSSKY